MATAEGRNLLGQPTFTKLPNGRLKCVETGHELSSRDKESYSHGKRCRLELINVALANQKPPLNMFSQDPNSRSNLICKLTGDTVSKSEEQIWKFMNGTRFLDKLEEQEREKMRANQLSGDGPSKKLKKKNNKKGKRKEKMADETYSEAIETSSKKNRTSDEEEDFWVPPIGERWDFDDGRDRWVSAEEDVEEGSETGSESEDVEEGGEPGSECDEVEERTGTAWDMEATCLVSQIAGHYLQECIWCSEEIPTKGSKRRKSVETGADRSASRNKKSNIDDFARGTSEEDRGKPGKGFTSPTHAWTDSCEAPLELPLEPQEILELPFVSNNIPSNPQEANDMNHATQVPISLSKKAPIAVAYGCFTSHAVVRDITHIMKENFMGPYNTWSAIPLDTRELYWRKFQDKFIVKEECYHEIKQVWELTSKRRYISMLSEARREALRKTGKKSVSETKSRGPSWMRPGIWSAIVDKWETPEWKVKSQVARKNRMTEKDGSITKHSGGSISFAEHKYRLAMELGREPTQAELFHRVHKGKGSSNQFIDNKSKRVMEAYQAALIEKYGPKGASKVTFDKEAWEKATGGPNRGRWYGYGLTQPHSDRYKASTPLYSRPEGPSRSSQISPEQLQEVLKANEELQGKIEQQKSEMEQQKLQMEERMEQQQSQIEMMQAKLGAMMAELDGRRVLRPRQARYGHSMSEH